MKKKVIDEYRLQLFLIDESSIHHRFSLFKGERKFLKHLTGYVQNMIQ